MLDFSYRRETYIKFFRTLTFEVDSSIVTIHFDDLTHTKNGMLDRIAFVELRNVPWLIVWNNRYIFGLCC